MDSLTRRDFLKITGAITAAPLASALRRASGAAPHPSPDVLVLVFDTLSAQHCSLYGYPRRTTPGLERLARISTVYHNHWAGGNFTVPGTSTLLSGTYPWTHRALHFYGSMQPDAAARTIFSTAPPAYETLAYTHNPLAHILLSQAKDAIDNLLPPSSLTADEGHLASAFPRDYESASNAEQVLRRVSPAKGFLPPSLLFFSVGDYFYRVVRDARNNASRRETFPRGVPSDARGTYFFLEDAMQWLGEEVRTPAPAPVLRYVHLLPPHEPYTPDSAFTDIFLHTTAGASPKPVHPLASRTAGQDRLSPSELEYQRRMYDEYLAYVDHHLGLLLDEMKRGGVLDKSILVITSDHGQLFERGVHGHTTPMLYEGLLHIPLLIHLPGQDTRLDVQTPTSAADLLPTLAHLLGQPAPASVEGRILPPFAPLRERPVFAVEAKESSKWGPLKRASFAMRLGKYKLIHYRGYAEAPENWELYNLAEDPQELHDIFGSDPRAADLQALLLETLNAKSCSLAATS